MKLENKQCSGVVDNSRRRSNSLRRHTCVGAHPNMQGFLLIAILGYPVENLFVWLAAKVSHLGNGCALTCSMFIA